ncbi:MAG: mechanosensitive ion channel domain-containing protein [Chlamydiota bacterium]|nr:mechanosensitive ion channel domain-containing protein [Chlamydiota bacterium]
MMESLLQFFWEREWLIQLSAILIFVIIFNFVIKKIIKGLQQRFSKRESYLLAGFFEAVDAPLYTFVWIFATIYSLTVIDKTIHDAPMYGELPDETLFFTGIILFGWFLFRWKQQAVKAMTSMSFLGKVNLDPHRINAVDKLLTIIIVFVVTIWLLEATGQGVGTLLTIGGIGAAAIGFASKEFIANFFGGFMIYINTPFHIGDVIDIPSRSTRGVVEEIGWYLTRVRDIEKLPIYIPNAMFSQFILINMSKRSHRRINETVGVRYEDYELVKDIIADIKLLIDNHPEIDQDQNKLVYFSAYADSTLDITLAAYTRITAIKPFNEFKESILFSVYDIIRKHGANFAYPTISIDKMVT